ncbi:MAG: hypothetical protein Q8R29_02005 [bacterium]|nr:hypothetical protein [bacterium]
MDAPCVVVKDLNDEPLCGSGATNVIHCNGLKDVNFILQTLKPKERVCKFCCAYLEAACKGAGIALGNPHTVGNPSKVLVNALKRF